jgi:hypothetical protein
VKPSRGWPVQSSEEASGPLVIDSGRRIGQSGAFQLVFGARLTMDRFVYFTTVNSPEGLKLSREIRARKLGDIAPSSTYLVIAGLAGPDYKVENEGEAVGPE